MLDEERFEELKRFVGVHAWVKPGALDVAIGEDDRHTVVDLCRQPGWEQSRT